MINKLSELEINKIKGVQNLRHFLKVESDRGCCLLAVSFLDNELKLLLDNKLVGETKFKKELFDLNGPLGTFSSKINLSYSIGLINKDLKNDIHVIRKIRNEFGHNYIQIDFDTVKIKNQIFQLKHNLYQKGEKDSRGIFIDTVTLILSEIHELYETHYKYPEKENKGYFEQPAFVNVIKHAIDQVYDLKE